MNSARKAPPTVTSAPMKFTPPWYLRHGLTPQASGFEFEFKQGRERACGAPVEDLRGDVAGHGAADDGAEHLCQDVAHGAEEGHLAGDGQAQRHGGVDVRPRDACRVEQPGLGL
jgi:hypothetical protein